MIQDGRLFCSWPSQIILILTQGKNIRLPGGHMTTTDITVWFQQNQGWGVAGIFLLSIFLFIFARSVIGRGLVYVTTRTASRYDDIVVKHLRPFRVAWLAPLIVWYACSALFPTSQVLIQKTSLFLIVWVVAVTINSLLNAVNEIYESSKNYTGVSIEGYLDIAKILLIIVAIILSVSMLTNESPLMLITGLGALTAVLLLIFQGTILSLVASVQIVANDLLKEGDWVEVPSFEANGDVVNIGLHTIKVRNFDMTYSIIPTHKVLDVAYKNWRGMKESGGRRIQRSISVDMISIKFCEPELFDRLHKIDLIHDLIEEKLKGLAAYRKEHKDHFDSPLDGPQITNIEIFRAYIVAYLRSRNDIHHETMPFLVRSLAPDPTGLPIELYIFAKTTDWAKYEGIQGDIFDHLLAAAPNFDLRVFQQPTGLDFSTFARSVK
jgi:miniconductance mechanosensitive channel